MKEKKKMCTPEHDPVYCIIIVLRDMHKKCHLTLDVPYELMKKKKKIKK